MMRRPCIALPAILLVTTACDGVVSRGPDDGFALDPTEVSDPGDPDPVEPSADAEAPSDGDDGALGDLDGGDGDGAGGGDGGDAGDDDAGGPTTPPLGRVVDIAASAYNGLAVLDDGTVWTWGDNNTYCGLGYPVWPEQRSPLQVPLSAPPVEVFSGSEKFVVTHADGSATAWGLGAAPLSTNDTRTFVCEPTPVVGVTNLSSFHGFSSNGYFTQADGSLWFSGFYWSPTGAFAAGTVSTAYRVTNLANVAVARGGFDMGVALSRDARVFTWGCCAPLRIKSATVNELVFDEITALLPPVRAVEVGHQAIYVLTTAGEVWAFGREAGGFGLANYVDWPTPTKLPFISDVAAIYPSSGASVIVVKNDGSVWGWGYNSQGVLCQPDLTRLYATPVPINLPAPVQKIAMGPSTSYFLLEDARLMACGNNAVGQLGTGGLEVRSQTPVEVRFPTP